MINRYSFQRGSRGGLFLTERLKNAKNYDRIAGYFNSSLLEFAGEAFETVSGRIRIICNSDLREQDVEAAGKAEQAQKLSFFRHDPETLSRQAGERLLRLQALLSLEGQGRLEIKVLPDTAFGLIHGKAGVITRADGSRTSFLGSVNETYSGWNLNYELVWEDDSPEACDWVQEEFDRLWNSPKAVPLARAVVTEVQRLSGRRELDLFSWREKPKPPGVIIESPVYREEFGLWPHQRSFVEQVWKAHNAMGARYILADQVGLGKTAQLGMAAQLMALTGNLPVLILLPKTLMVQWQTELWDLMEIPSARWTGKNWVDEGGYEHTPEGKNPLLNCPRRIGMISQGLITRGSEQVNALLKMEWEGVIVDEAHRARRKKLPKLEDRGPAVKNPLTEGNKLYAYLYQLASRTRTMLFGTATPVQMHPIEAWDLLRILSEANDHVLGSKSSGWRQPENALPYLLNEAPPPREEQELWDWLRNPFPPSWEGLVYRTCRRRLNVNDAEAVLINEHRIFSDLPSDIRTQIHPVLEDLFSNHHPFLRHIIRRTRGYLENAVDPKTNETYLKAIKINLLDDEPVHLESYLAQGYRGAEEFCRLLSRRVRGAGFFRTLLLRRIGSSIRAGLNTVEMMLDSWNTDLEEEEDIEEEEPQERKPDIKNLTREEIRILEECREALAIGLAQQEGADPKRDIIITYLKDRGWRERGCILFSQYYDTANYIAQAITREFPGETVGIYAGSDKSGIWEDGRFLRKDREYIKARVKKEEIKILVGTDTASEGLNLQALGTLINVDLPWNPTRLEQRKGRIQRIGQNRDTLDILNLRYKDSVEDKVHKALSDRLEKINLLFGQIPDILKDVWVQVALDNLEEAKKLIDDFPKSNPFDDRYSRMDSVPEWDTWQEVLNRHEKLEELRRGW